jgi:hypothetical protein
MAAQIAAPEASATPQLEALVTAPLDSPPPASSGSLAERLRGSLRKTYAVFSGVRFARPAPAPPNRPVNVASQTPGTVASQTPVSPPPEVELATTAHVLATVPGIGDVPVFSPPETTQAPSPTPYPVAGRENAAARRQSPTSPFHDEDEPSNQSEPRARRSRSFGPQVIAWNGIVRGERIIKLELPGATGTVEIPRGYRQRVGVVEPPGPENRWRFVVLRIFGRGEVSIILRWWPSGMSS